MKNLKTVRVKVPASSANLGPGYDVLGIALKLYNEVELSIGQTQNSLAVEIEGEGAESLPRDEKNIVWQAASKVFKRAGKKPGACKLKMLNHIPLARGLGSSAAARLSGVLAANALCGNFLTQGEILNCAAELEGHPDNIVPSLVGGLTIAGLDGGRVEFVKLPAPKDLCAVVCVPGFELSTKKARSVLPKTIPHRDAVYNISRVSMLLGALASKNYSLLKSAVQDRLHEPYRKKLVPGFDEVLKNGYRAGALGIALSGAGPSIFAFSVKEKAAWVGKAMERGFSKFRIDAKSSVLSFDAVGAVITE